MRRPVAQRWPWWSSRRRRCRRRHRLAMAVATRPLPFPFAWQGQVRYDDAGRGTLCSSSRSPRGARTSPNDLQARVCENALLSSRIHFNSTPPEKWKLTDSRTRVRRSLPAISLLPLPKSPDASSKIATALWIRQGAKSVIEYCYIVEFTEVGATSAGAARLRLPRTARGTTSTPPQWVTPDATSSSPTSM